MEGKSVSIPILIYHDLGSKFAPQGIKKDPYLLAESDFEEQMNYLHSQGYCVISLSNLVAWISGEVNLPVKSVVITFDDGHESHYTVAYLILRKYDFTATFFLIAQSIGFPGMLSLEQIKEMSDNDVSIQSHTLNHPYLIQLGREEIEKELRESKTILEELVGKPVDFLAIPGGLYNNIVIKLATETGYRAVLTSDIGLNQASSDLYRLKRISVNQGITLSEFASLLQGRGLGRKRFTQSLRNALKRILGIERYIYLKRRWFRLKEITIAKE